MNNLFSRTLLVALLQGKAGPEAAAGYVTGGSGVPALAAATGGAVPSDADTDTGLSDEEGLGEEEGATGEDNAVDSGDDMSSGDDVFEQARAGQYTNNQGNILTPHSTIYPLYPTPQYTHSTLHCMPARTQP